MSAARHPQRRCRRAVHDTDGVFRAVVSHEDAGVQNWLDPVGNTRGQILNCLNRAKEKPAPRARLVPFAELRKHLPREASKDRRRQIAARTNAARRRYNY